MALNIRVEMSDTNIIMRRLGIEEKGRAQLFLSNESFRLMSKYVPMKTGALRDTVDILAESLTYLVPYANRQYRTNRGSGIRGKYWDKKMLSAEKNTLINNLENYIRRG